MRTLSSARWASPRLPVGEANDLPEFVAAGLFLEQYLANLDQQSATDYSDLIRRAVIEASPSRTTTRAWCPET